MRQSPVFRALCLSMRARRLGLSLISLTFAAGTVAAGGCGAVSTAQGGVDQSLGSVTSAKGSADQTKALGTDIKNGITGKKPDPVEDPNKKEDEDGKRILAKQTRLNQPVNDELNVVKNDPVDWKAYDLSGVQGRSWVLFELNWDDKDAEINLDVYDQVGAQVVQSPGRSGIPQKKIPLKVETPGVYYARIAMQTGFPKSDSVYTVLLRTKPGVALSRPTDVRGKKDGDPAAGAPAAGAPAAGAPAAGGPAMAGGAPIPGGNPQPGFPQGGMGMGGMQGGMGMGMGGMQGGMGMGGMQGGMGMGGMQGGMNGGMNGQGGQGGTPAAPPADPNAVPAGAVTGKIVQSFRGDDNKMTMYLNKGTKDKLRVGMAGNILDGSDGGKTLEGATFTITKVLGENQSVATSNYGKSLGKNNRFMVAKPK